MLYKLRGLSQHLLYREDLGKDGADYICRVCHIFLFHTDICKIPDHSYIVYKNVAAKNDILDNMMNKNLHREDCDFAALLKEIENND